MIEYIKEVEGGGNKLPHFIVFIELKKEGILYIESRIEATGI